LKGPGLKPDFLTARCFSGLKATAPSGETGNNNGKVEKNFSMQPAAETESQVCDLMAITLETDEWFILIVR
jgi:hypothetical protein